MSASEDRGPIPSQSNDGSSAPFGATRSSPSDGALADVQQRVADAARGAADAARGAAHETKRRAESVYRQTSGVAADASAALDDAADSLDSSGHETLSQAAAALSDRVRAFSTYLEDRRLEDLIGDARRLAQRNPGLFIAGGVALGFALSRFLKASAPDATRRRDLM